jgi:hypothetical protein
MGERMRKPAGFRAAQRSAQDRLRPTHEAPDFADNRPEADEVRQMQRLADNAPRTVGHRAMQDSMRTVQRRASSPSIEYSPRMAAQRQAQQAINRTGLPDTLKSGVEALSGMSLDHVRVHYNSSRPAQLNAHAYAQGSDIHLASGQEHHLPHEAWHVVQQAQGRVPPTMDVAGHPVNDDPTLENEADAMGGKALKAPVTQTVAQAMPRVGHVVQRVMVGSVDITKTSKVDDIIATLGWTRNYGFSVKLSKETLQALKTELTGVDGCDLILESIDDALEDDTASDSDSDNDDVEKEPVIAEEFVSEEEALKRRKQAAEDFGWNTYPDVIGSYVKLGVHETKASNNESLVANGPRDDRIDTSGHGIGKGRGFYVTHVGQQTLFNAIRAIRYEENFVAVYIHSSAKRRQSRSEETNSVAELDKIYAGENCYYVMSGGSEIIIPPRSFGLVRIVASQADAERLG